MRTWQAGIITAGLITGAIVSVAGHGATAPMAGAPVAALPVCSDSVARMAQPFLDRDLASPFADLCVIVTDGADLADTTDPL